MANLARALLLVGRNHASRFCLISILLSFVLNSVLVRAGEPPLTIAAASDLNHVMKSLTPAFHQHCKCTTIVTPTFGASGQLFAQIKNGAEFDVFMSADRSYPKRLVDDGLAQSGDTEPYARGRLALVYNLDTQFAAAVREFMKTPLEDRGNSLQKIKSFAIANPEHAPYGRAARAVLDKVAWSKPLEGKLVRGENVAQTFHFIVSGAAEAGIVALSLVKRAELKKPLSYMPIPPNLHEYTPDGQLEQVAVALKKSPNIKAARVFLDFLKSDVARKVFSEAGFDPP